MENISKFLTLMHPLLDLIAGLVENIISQSFRLSFYIVLLISRLYSGHHEP